MDEMLATFEWSTALLVFGLFVVMDVLYAWYTLSVTKAQPWKASFTAAVMYFINAVGVINYTHNHLYLVFIAVGSFIGTYVVVKREADKNTGS